MNGQKINGGSRVMREEPLGANATWQARFVNGLKPLLGGLMRTLRNQDGFIGSRNEQSADHSHPGRSASSSDPWWEPEPERGERQRSQPNNGANPTKLAGVYENGGELDPCR